MANNSSSMLKHHQEPPLSVPPQMSRHHHQQQQQQQHHHHQHGLSDSCAGGGSASSSSIQLQPPASSLSHVPPYDGKALASGILESSGAATATRFQPNLHGMSLDWTPEEQAILDDGLIQFANESSLVRYAKIAVSLKNKTVRDVAMRCKWMSKRDKRRKDDLSLTRRSKERKERPTDNSALSSHAALQPGYPPYAQGVVTNKNDFGISYNGIDAVTKDLLRQNCQAFEQINANLATCQIQNNIRLFCQARDNISQILKRVHEPPYVMKQMPPISVQVNEELANAVLSQSNIAMQ